MTINSYKAVCPKSVVTSVVSWVFMRVFAIVVSWVFKDRRSPLLFFFTELKLGIGINLRKRRSYIYN